MPNERARGETAGLARRIGDYVNHDHVFVRFLALWLLCVTLFTAA